MDGSQITVRLIRFEGDENAAHYMRDNLDLNKMWDKALRDDEVPGIPGARSLVGGTPVEGSNTTTSAAPAGDVTVFVLLDSAEPQSADVTEKILAEQYARM
ncbi:hypothetical protein [Actinoplanes sp. NPDC051494]|uniref:hypothetical protein n=1 Tax=Actinoplanes sp. NPDC051494 TaxID=3363907 RepID=UPI0037B461FF